MDDGCEWKGRSAERGVWADSPCERRGSRRQGPEVESCNGKALREWLEQQHLAAVNTMRPEVSTTRRRGHAWETGPTFRRLDGAATRIDYIATLKGLLNNVVEVKFFEAAHIGCSWQTARSCVTTSRFVSS